MQIQRGAYEFSIIDGNQMAVFHDKKSRPVYFEKFDLRELTDAYMIVNDLDYAVMDNHECLLDSLRNKSFPKLYNSLRKYVHFSTAKSYYMGFLDWVRDDPRMWSTGINRNIVKRSKIVQINLFKNSEKLQEWKNSVKPSETVVNSMALLFTTFFPNWKETNWEEKPYKVYKKMFDKNKGIYEKLFDFDEKFYKDIKSSQFLDLLDTQKPKDKRVFSCLKNLDEAR